MEVEKTGGATATPGETIWKLPGKRDLGGIESFVSFGNCSFYKFVTAGFEGKVKGEWKGAEPISPPGDVTIGAGVGQEFLSFTLTSPPSLLLYITVGYIFLEEFH